MRRDTSGSSVSKPTLLTSKSTHFNLTQPQRCVSEGGKLEWKWSSTSHNTSFKSPPHRLASMPSL
ncbi:hypothetical protein E2C01_094491 [Portunus trituberculatus]|uniref:Uncharacterized protein n=1 Tax=Portunus trituberculatus TaxID=210409 RepID=A0A5B7JX04_PORTR|nr:hypothetical protein [Portunus trituberculatus]